MIPLYWMFQCVRIDMLIVDADGNVIAKADDTEQILYMNIDLAESDRTRKSRPYTNLRRKEFYI